MERSLPEEALLARRATNEPVPSLAERRAFRANPDVRCSGELAFQSGGVAIGDVGAEGDKLARSGDMCEGHGLASRDDLVCACTSNREIVHTTKDVLKVEGPTRLDDREGLGLDGGGRRPLDLLWYDEIDLAAIWARVSSN